MATEFTLGSIFNAYFLPKVHLTDAAQQVSGMTVLESGQMKVNGADVQCESIDSSILVLRSGCQIFRSCLKHSQWETLWLPCILLNNRETWTNHFTAQIDS